MNHKIIYIGIFCLLASCIKQNEKPKGVLTTISGRVFHKYYNTPYKNKEVFVTRRSATFDNWIPSLTTESLGTTHTDDNGNYRISFVFEEKYSGVQVGVFEEGASSYVPITHAGDQDIDIKVVPLVTVIAAIHFFNNRYPPMSMSADGKYFSSDFNNPLWDKFSGDTTIILPHHYDTAFVMEYLNYHNMDGIKHPIPLGSYADTIRVTDTVNMNF